MRKRKLNDRPCYCYCFGEAGEDNPTEYTVSKILADMGIISTAKSLYVRLLDKTINEKEADDDGHLYTRFPISEQVAVLSKSNATVKRALLELEQSGLLKRKRQGRGRLNKLYILA